MIYISTDGDKCRLLCDMYLVEREDYEHLTGEVVEDVRLAPRACTHHLHDVRVGQLLRHSHLL